jgi:hypothetical protein
MLSQLKKKLRINTELVKLSEVWVGSEIRSPEKTYPGSRLIAFPDPRGKTGPDPGSESATINEVEESPCTHLTLKAVSDRQRLEVDVVQVGVYLQMLVVPRLCLSGEGVWHQAEYLRLLVPALRNIILKTTSEVVLCNRLVFHCVVDP